MPTAQSHRSLSYAGLSVLFGRSAVPGSERSVGKRVRILPLMAVVAVPLFPVSQSEDLQA